MARIAFLFMSVLMIASSQAQANMTFTDNFDMRGDYTQYLYSTTNASVNSEAPYFSDVSYWAPTYNNTWAEITYKYDLPFTISHAEINAWIGAFNVNYDPGAKAFVDVSPDGVNWTTVESNFYDQPIPIDVSSILAGSTTAFVRGRLFETQSNGPIHYAQFLRTANGVKAPDVYQFTASGQAVPEPSTFAMVCLVLLSPLRSELILQSRHEFTRSMVIQTSLLVAAQPAGAATAEQVRGIDL